MSTSTQSLTELYDSVMTPEDLQALRSMSLSPEEEHNWKAVVGSARLFNEGRLDESVASFADDAVRYLTPGGPPLVGKEAIVKDFKEFFDGVASANYKILDTFVSGAVVGATFMLDMVYKTGQRSKIFAMTVSQFDEAGYRIAMSGINTEWRPRPHGAMDIDRIPRSDGVGQVEARNLAIVEEGIPAFHAKDPEGSVSGFTSESVWYSNAFERPLIGREAAAEGIARVFRTFLDADFKVADMFASGNRVVVRFEVHGTATHAFMGLPPRQAPYSFFETVISIFNDAGDRVAVWDAWNQVAVLRDQGVIPDSFAGQETVIRGAPKGAMSSALPAPARQASPVGEISILSELPTGADPRTYKLETVKAELDRVANFVWSVDGGQHFQERNVEHQGQLVGSDMEFGLASTDIQLGVLRGLGAPLGNAQLSWRAIPKDFVAQPGKPIPPTPVDARGHQRFVVEGKIALQDRLKSSSRVFGTGAYWPMRDDRVPLEAGAILELRGESTGQLATSDSVLLINGGFLSSQPPICTLRLRDPGRSLGSCALVHRQPLAAAQPDSLDLVLAGSLDSRRPFDFRFDSRGQFRGASGYEKLRLVDLRSVIRGGKLRSRTLCRTVVGDISYEVFFDAFADATVLPFQTRQAKFRFHDSRGKDIAGLRADIVDGRALPTRLPGLQQPVFRMGGLAPAMSGSGAFQGVSGMVTVDAWLSPFPSYISSVIVFRLSDPGQRLGKLLTKAWTG